MHLSILYCIPVRVYLERVKSITVTVQFAWENVMLLNHCPWYICICLTWSSVPQLGQLPESNVIRSVSELNSFRPSDAYMRQKPNPSLVKIMACRLFRAKPLSEPMLEYWWLDPYLGTNFSEILIFSLKKMRLKVSSAKWRPFCLGLNVLVRNMWLEITHLPGANELKEAHAYLLI